jgi:hypothetical protein
MILERLHPICFGQERLVSHLGVERTVEIIHLLLLSELPLEEMWVEVLLGEFMNLLLGLSLEAFTMT